MEYLLKITAEILRELKKSEGKLNNDAKLKLKVTY